MISEAKGLGDAAVREAEQLAAHLIPDQWPLEWHLPFWLGADFGLAEPVWRQLVAVNLLGMAHVRLADDLADETLDGPRRAVKTALGRRLLATSGDLLQGLFEPASPFWSRHAMYLDQWRRAGEEEDAWRDAPRDRLLEDWQWLAWRGAPAKITAIGACLLAGRDAVIAALETCIDHTMAATVLLDHADDWPADLPAGRFNAYAFWLSDLPQHARFAERNRRQVLAALMHGDGAGHRSYYRLVDEHMVAAQQVAGPVGSAGLSAYLASFRQDAQVQGASQLESARKTLRDALADLLAGFDG